MKIDAVRYQGRPAEKRGEEEEAIYDKLEELGIDFYRADHEFANTMEDCDLIEQVLGCGICKNLFLCNRQQTDFYLLLMPGDKPFKTKYLSAQLGCARLSFADESRLGEFLHTIPGSVSALELLFDTQGRVRLLVDAELLEQPDYCGHPGRSTSTLRMKRVDFMKFAASCGHEPTVISLPREEEHA